MGERAYWIPVEIEVEQRKRRLGTGRHVDEYVIHIDGGAREVNLYANVGIVFPVVVRRVMPRPVEHLAWVDETTRFDGAGGACLADVPLRVAGEIGRDETGDRIALLVVDCTIR